MSIFAIPSGTTRRKRRRVPRCLVTERKTNTSLQPRPGCRACWQSRIYVFGSEDNLSSRNAWHLGRTSPSLRGSQWAGGGRGAPCCGLREGPALRSCLPCLLQGNYCPFAGTKEEQSPYVPTFFSPASACLAIVVRSHAGVEGDDF